MSLCTSLIDLVVDVGWWKKKKVFCPPAAKVFFFQLSWHRCFAIINLARRRYCRSPWVQKKEKKNGKKTPPCCLAMIREWQARRWIPPQVDSLLPVERECVHALNQAVVRNDWAHQLKEEPTFCDAVLPPRRHRQLSQLSAFEPPMRWVLKVTKKKKKASSFAALEREVPFLLVLGFYFLRFDLSLFASAIAISCVIANIAVTGKI